MDGHGTVDLVRRKRLGGLYDVIHDAAADPRPIVAETAKLTLKEAGGVMRPEV